VILGSGQFCTKPGLVFTPRQPETQAFLDELTGKVKGTPAQTMLTSAIAGKYRSVVKDRQAKNEPAVLAQADASADGDAHTQPVLFRTNARDFLERKELSHEVFGPTSLLIEYTSHAEILQAALQLEGHLTATVHGTAADLESHRDLIAILEKKVGRIVFNGYPTGVEVCHAMVHGGPYPATSDGRSTSVGTMAILRFARPVCYQACPESLLPDELKLANPRKIWRLVDGNFTQEAPKK
jgi:NADP-dependent aldehyde dehydrogenase